MNDLSGKWALVTGASSGFGVEFARLLAAHQANLVLVARRAEPMNKLADDLRKKHAVQVEVLGMDLSRAGAGPELKADLDRRGIAIEILVNNAGFGIYGDFCWSQAFGAFLLPSQHHAVLKAVAVSGISLYLGSGQYGKFQLSSPADQVPTAVFQWLQRSCELHLLEDADGQQRGRRWDPEPDWDLQRLR